MKSILVKTIAVLAIFGVAQSAFAARPYAEAVTYVDSSGTVIGGDVVFCNNVGYHMGTTSSDYVVALVSCGETPYQSPVYPGSGVETYVLPGAETIEEGCLTNGVQCLKGGVQPNINNVNGLTWVSGWVNPTF